MIIDEVMNLDKLSEVEPSTIERMHLSIVDAIAWCLDPLVDYQLRKEACTRFIATIRRFVELLSRYRLSKVLRGAEVREGYDRKMLEIIDDAIKYFASISIEGLKIVEGEVLCKVLKPIPLKKSIATPGYIVSLPLWEAAIFAALRFVKPLSVPLDIISF